MNIVDIILLVFLLFAIFEGFKDGFFVQIAGLIGLILGVYIAYYYSESLGKIIALKEFSTEIAFVIIVIGVIILLGILGKILGKIFDSLGLGLFNRLGGVVIAVIKMSLLLGALMIVLDVLTDKGESSTKQKIEESKLYKPIESISSYIFPYLTFSGDKIIELYGKDKNDNQ